MKTTKQLLLLCKNVKQYKCVNYVVCKKLFLKCSYKRMESRYRLSDVWRGASERGTYRWGHRSRGVTSSVASRVPWCHRFRGVICSVTSLVPWCNRFLGVICSVASHVPWRHRSRDLSFAPRPTLPCIVFVSPCDRHTGDDNLISMEDQKLFFQLIVFNKACSVRGGR